MKTQKINLKGLNCSSCATKIEDQVNKQEYVEKAVLNFVDQSIKITYTDLTKEQLLENVTAIVNSIEDGVIISTEEIVVEKDNKLMVKIARIVIGIILIIFMYFTQYSFELYLKLFVYLLFGYDVIFKALKKVFTKDIFNENFLMSFATVSAFAIGEVNEAIGVMLFYQIGEFFQDLAVGNSRRSIENLMDIAVESANLVDGDQVKVIDSKDIKMGDILVVKVGEKIPVDGTVIEGSSRLDTSSLTGESAPIKVDVDEAVLSGVINLSQVIKIKATRTYDDSTVATIIELVKDSATHKGETEKFITKFAKVYTPIVLLLAFLLVLIPTLINPSEFSIWFERSLIFLVVSCPCALVASIPLTFFSGLGYSSKRGILVKGSNYLQGITNVSKVVFDKTGTITKGNFSVTEFNCIDNIEQFVDIVYNCENQSNHPIAKSIVNYLKVNYEVKASSYVVKEVAGMGISATSNGDKIYIGNSRLLTINGIEHEQVTSNGSCVYVTLNDKCLGYIIVSDQIKDEAKKVISKLNKQNIETIMLTGDKESEAKYIANEVGIHTVHYNLLPQDKVEIFSKICDDNEELTVFIGDGINDAPVLKRSDIGIAMGTIGSDAAIEASDVVIMNDNLNSITKLIRIAKNTMKIAKQNIVLALGIKSIILVLGAFGLASMWLAIFADVGVTLIAILNASRKK